MNRIGHSPEFGKRNFLKFFLRHRQLSNVRRNSGGPASPGRDLDPRADTLGRLRLEHGCTQAITEDRAATVPNERRGVVADDREGDHRQPRRAKHDKHFTLP